MEDADGDISIHAPRTGSDDPVDALFPDEYSISIHAPRTGSDPAKESSSNLYKVFQSTLPARGATRFWRLAK